MKLGVLFFATPKPIRAFSLVELSIVLVILGLLVGGILGGKSLIRASELRTITTQYQGYVTAARSFRDKYFMLPGDMNNATQFWGVAAGTGSNMACRDFASTSAATCDGDGNGFIDYPNGKPMEQFRFWQHLANAGLVEGSFTGMDISPPQPGNSTTNSPVGKLSGSLWYVYSGQKYSPSSNMAFANEFNLDYGNYLLLATNVPFSGGVQRTPLLPAEDMWNIDSKMDDGKPGSGKLVVVATGGLSTCTTTASGVAYTADYLLTATDKVCSLIFPQAF